MYIEKRGKSATNCNCKVKTNLVWSGLICAYFYQNSWWIPDEKYLYGHLIEDDNKKAYFDMDCFVFALLKGQSHKKCSCRPIIPDCKIQGS